MNGIIPWRLKGLMKGRVEILGKSVWDYEFNKLSRQVGLVKQNPLDQLVTFTVKDEIAFGLENLLYPKEEIEERIKDIAKFMNIDHLLDRNIDQLSGGQKQLTILSSFLVLNPKILILDEPIAFLDQDSESLLLERLKHIIDSNLFDLTLVIIEHRLSRVKDIADKIIILDDKGSISINGTIKDTFTNNFDSLKSTNVRVPWIIDLFHHFKEETEIDLSNKEIPWDFASLKYFIADLNQEEKKLFRRILMDNEIMPHELESFRNYDDVIKFRDVYSEKMKQITRAEEHFDIRNKEKVKNELQNKGEIILETKNLTFEYPNSDIKALSHLDLKVKEGDFIGLIGPNGSGKTTLLYLLANLYEPTNGDICFKGKNLKDIDFMEYAQNIGFIFQNPENMIFKSSLREEIMYGPKNFGIDEQVRESYLEKLIGLIGEVDAERNPFKLSWGQKRRLNLSSIFVYKPSIILLDEPFIGQDQRTIDSIAQTLYIENKRGKTIIISSHDYPLLLKYTKTILELNHDGTLRHYDDKLAFFKEHKNLGPMEILKLIEGKRN
ncbi:MAG: putative enzyme [Promethearchaeota archaeon]|nr:MAG: putative enzyme [Candidatus Lokiarchaeota archaeon]